MSLVRSVSGIRGLVGSDLHPSNVAAFAETFARFVEDGKVICGRDTRQSGVEFSSIFASVFNFYGIDVIDTGIVPTPTVLYGVSKLDADGGFIITASHNPPQYNGIKLVSSSGKFLNDKEYRHFTELENNPEHIYSPGGSLIENRDIADMHINDVLSIDFLDIDMIKKSNLRVVFDGGSGGGSIVIPRLLRELGVDLYEINTNTDGKFRRNPEPVPENLSGLADAVKKHDADIGLATDGDGDRIAIVSNHRGPVGEEYTIALAGDFVMRKKSAGCIVINQSTSAMIEHLGRRNGYKIVRTPVGEANVVDGIIANNAVIGGEGNGGIILPSVNKTRDALAGSAVILQMLAESPSTLDEMIDNLPELFMKKLKYPLSDDSVFDSIREIYTDADFNDADGARYQFDEGFIHIRKSGTEPVMRIIGEFENEKQWNKQFSRIRGVVECAE
ncbi:MAG: phosphoglucosamine mutase [candidate division WOR-3 bacterium]|nr:phosphoglucosamine mutase [candidate division WOR-3 bacterium]